MLCTNDCRADSTFPNTDSAPRRIGLPARALLAVAALTAAPLAHAADNGRIAYVACNANYTLCDIWTMNADGSNPVNVTNTSDVSEGSPAFSPDGSKIAFLRAASPWTNNLWTMNADGTNQIQITTTPSTQFGPSWSPGGTQIALARQYPGSPVAYQYDIVIVNVDGSGERNLTNSSFDEMYPAWSPDGATIAFAGVRLEQYPDPTGGGTLQGAQWEIVTVDIDGGNEVIVSAGAPNSDRANNLETDSEPAWSPDGSQLVFTSSAQLWIANRDGSGLANISPDVSAFDGSPTWSPDGARILFERLDDIGGHHLYTMPAPYTATTVTATKISTISYAQDSDWQRLNSAAMSPLPLAVSVMTNSKSTGGTVDSDIAGIRCGHDCAESYPAGTVVQLTASPKKGSMFEGWSGACSGISPVCEIPVNDARWVGASFVRTK